MREISGILKSDGRIFAREKSPPSISKQTATRLAKRITINTLGGVSHGRSPRFVNHFPQHPDSIIIAHVFKVHVVDLGKLGT